MKDWKNILKLSQEQLEKKDQKPDVNREHEICIYGKMNNAEGLTAANSKESHEQWEIKTELGRMRVRKTIKDGLDPIFELTFKNKNKDFGLDGNIESNFEINESIFQNIKNLSSAGMIKDRYKFLVNSVDISNEKGIQDIHIPEMFYEVDVFYTLDHEGNKNYKPWVKVDLEVNKLMEIINANHKDLGEFNLNIKASKLPIDLSDLVLSTDEDPVAKETIRKLYDDYFLTKK